MLRRLLFFLFVFCTVIGGFAQTFTLEAEQSLNAAKDSLVVSIYIQSSSDDQLGNADFVFDVDTNALFIDEGSIDDTGSPYSNNSSYKAITYNFNTTFGYFNIPVRQESPLTNPGGPNVLAASRTKVADVYIRIRDKCLFDSLEWRTSPPTGAIQKWTGPVATNKLATTPFILRDSIGGTVQITATSDTVCQGSDIDIAFMLSGEETFNIRFGNGTDSYLAAGINTVNVPTLYTPTILGEAIYVIDSIEDTNGCWESNPANFTEDTAFIDATVVGANAGLDDSVCVQPKTITLAGNDPTAAFNGTWTSNSTGAIFTDASLFNTSVLVDTGGYYNFTWTIRSLIDGAVGACPSEEDSARIRFFRQPSPAIIDSVSYNRCINSLPSNIANIIANPLDTGIGAWSIIGAPGGAVGPFFGDINNDTTSFSTNVQGQYNIQWEITWGNCPTTNDAVQVNFELEAQTPNITTPDDSQCEEIANLVAVDIPVVGNLETWTTTSSAIIAGTTSPTTTATLPTYTVDSTFTFYWNSENTTIFGVCPIKQDSVKITRLAQPDTTASLNANNTTPACGGVETYTIANIVVGSNYNWILPGGFTITNSNADSTFIDVAIADPSFAGNIIIIENTALGCSGGVDTLFVSPTGCQFEASFSVFPNDTICVGDEITLVSNTAGSILASTQYQWDSTETGGFTNFIPLTTDADTALATFSDPGNWQIRMTASEPTLAPFPLVDDTIINIVVLAPPTATFVLNSGNTICEGDTVEFQVNITGGAPPYTVDIDTGGGGSIMISNYTSGDPIRIIPTGNTTYNLNSVSDGFSCSGGLITTVPTTITVNPLPNLSITTPSFPNLCLGDSILIGFSATGNLPYPNVYINSAGGQEIVAVTGGTQNIYFTPSTTGLFVYSIDSVEDSNLCVATSAPNINGTATVTVIDGIDSATFVGDTAICFMESTPLTATAFGGNPNYTYYFTGRPDAVQPSPFTFLDTPPATTSYILDSVDDANGCRVFVVDTVTVTVNPLPAATFTRLAPLGTLCLGDTAVFDLTFTAGTFPITVDFNNDGASNILIINADTTISIPQSAAGTTNYGINSISDANGCSESTFPANISVITNDAPVAGVLTGGDVICAGDNDTLNVTFTGGNPVFSITVTNIGVITPYVSGDDIIVSPVANTTYTLTNITDANGCTFDTIASTATTVSPLPTATIATSTPTICLGDPADIVLNFTGTGPFNVIYTDGVTNYSETGLSSPVTVQVTPLVDSIFNFVLDSVFDTGSGCSETLPANLTGTATVAVNPTTAPTVSVVQSPANPVCAGDLITFTVLATDTGAAPSWQWYQDDLALVGQNSNTFSSNSPPLADGSEVKVELNVGAGCAVPSIVFDSVILDIQTNVTPSITLTQTPSNPVCNDDTITFDATIVGGGASPNIIWTLDGTPILPNDELSKTITSGFVNGSVVRAILNSSFGCATPSSDTTNTTINVTGSVAPLVNIIQSPGNPVCASDSVFFVAQNTGGGASPSFVWSVNSAIQAGAVTDTFSYFPRVDLDSISVVMTSSSTCATPTSVSDGHILNIETSVTPLINVSQTPNGPVCPGEDVVFDATISGGGTSPTVRWYVDGVLEAISEDFTFFNATAPGPYNVQGILTSNASCAPGLKTDTFTTTINIQSPVDPSVQIVQSPNNPVCVGDPVNFSVNATGQGANPTYQWFYNNVSVSTSPTYNAPSVSNNDEIRVVLTSSNPGSCTSNPIARDTVNIQTETAIPLAGTIVSDPVGVQYCPGQTVTFSFQGTGQGSNPSFAWTISSIPGIQSTDSTFTYTLPGASPAFYSVAVNVTSSNSCAVPLSQPFTAPVIVNLGALPIVDIVQSPGNPVCAGENINFTVNTQNEGINPTYAWFVNGAFQTSNPTGIYNSSTLADGDQVVVRLTTTACSGSATAFDTVIIQHDNPIIPQVEIDVTPDSVLCANEFVTFTANPSGQGPNPSYTWFVDGTPVSNGSFYTTSFGTAGPREVVLELNRNQSCGGPTTDRDTMTVVVTTFGTVNVNILRTPAGPICDGDPVTFEATGTHVGLSPTYTWRKNGTIFSIGPIVSTTINNLDDIRVDVSYINPCSGASSTFAELNNIPTTGPGTPSVAIVQDPLNPICPNELIQFSTVDTLEGSSPNYRWYKNGVLEVADPTYTYFATTADDTIIVEMTSSASCASPSIVRDTVITNFIQTDLDTAIGDTTIFCFGDSVTLILEDTANVTIEWFSLNSSGADVSLGTADSVTIFNTDSVYGIISNGRCTESTDTVLISVYQPYTGTITTSGLTDLCFGDQVILSVDDSLGYTHQWLYGFDTITLETDTFLTVNYTGSFNVIVQNNVCIDTIGAQNVQVAPPIDSVVSILIGDSVFCEGDSVLIGVPSVRGNALGGSLGSSYVQTTFIGVPGNGTRSLEAWLQTDTTGGIMGYGSDAIGQAFVVRIQNNSETPGQGNNGALKVAVKNGYITGTTNIADNSPHHVAVVFEGDSVNDIQLFVDGQLETISSISDEVINTGAAVNFRIGTTNVGFTPSIRFGGRIDEVRFWDFALDTATIRNNAVLPLSGLEPGLLGLWNFEDTTGGTAKDLVAGNDGTLLIGARFINERGFYNPSPSVTYEWVNALTGFSYGAVPDTFAIWVDSTGDYYVNITNGTCTQTSDTISIREVIQNPVITAGGATDLCFGDSVLLTAIGQTSLEDSTVWHYASNPIAGATTNTLTADASGAYSIVFFDNGCSDTSNVIIVDVAPEIDTTMTINGDTALCDGDTTFLSVPLNGGNNLRQLAKADVIRDIGNLSDFSFIHERGKFTIQYWQKLDNPNASPKINTAIGNAFDGSDPGFFAGYQRGNVGGINLNGQFKLHLDGGGAPWIFHTTGSPQITDTLWHQVTIVVDSNEAMFYMDNQVIPSTIALGTPVYAIPPTPAINRVTIGDANSFPGAFDLTNRGGVDEVRIWNLPLDSSTIANNWYRPLNGNEPGLVALFDLDEDTTLSAGDIVNDLTASGLTGTINGGAQIESFQNSMPTDSLTYQWYNNGTLIAGATSNVLPVDSTGSYFVVISTANGLCSDTSRTIDINRYSVDPAISVLNNDTVCFGDSVQLQALNNAGAIDSVKWFYGSYLVDSINNPYSATLSGVYQVVVFNNVCSDTSLVQNVVVKKAIDSTLSVSGDSVLCADDTVFLSVPKYGSSSLHITANGSDLNNIGVPGDFDFIHQTGDFTLETWMKLDNNNNNQHYILGNTNQIAEIGFDLVHIVNPAGQGQLRLRFYESGTITTYFSGLITDASNFDQWNHIAISVENGNASFYFNGSFVILRTGFNPIGGVANNALTIGGPGPSIQGKLDELRIWKTPLTLAQINQNRFRPLNFNTDIATIFSFDVDSTLSTGDNISDNSGLFTGTMNGSDIQTDADNPFQPSTELTYQWFQNGSLIAGAVGDSLLITTADFTDSADYYVEIDNSLNCGPIPSRTIKIKENIISDTLFASPTEFCAGTDSARVWVQLDVYDYVEIYNLQSITPLAVLTNTADTFFVNDTDTVYGVVYNSIDGKLCTQNTDTIIITAFENPTVQFANDSLVICIDDSDTLFSFLRMDSVYGGTGFGTYTYIWSPGDSLSGNDSTLLQPVYTADTSGIFFFTLVATDTNGCFGQDSIKIVTYDRVVPTFTQDTFTICFGNSISLGDSLTVIGGKPGTSYKYLWNPTTLFDNPADSTSDNPLLVGDSSGTFTFTLIVTDSITDCTGLTTITVVVGDSLRFNAFTDTLICFNTDSIQLGGTPTADGGTGTITYSWNPVTNLSDTLISNPYFLNPSVAGSYTFFITATDALGCFKTSDSINIEVAPEIMVDAGSDTVLCFGDTTLVIGGIPTASGGFGTFGYQWSSLTPSIPVSILNDPTLANPTVIYNTAVTNDSAIFVLTVFDTAALPNVTLCDVSDTVVVYFNPEIFADTGSVNFVCFDDTISLDGSATGGTNTGYTFQWIGDIAKVNDPTNPNSNFTGDSSGLYNLNLIAFDNTYPQCFDTSALLILEVNDTIFANAGIDTAICYGDEIGLGGLIGTDTTGSGGTDPFVFNWIQIAGSPAPLLNTNSNYPLFNSGGIAVGGIYSYSVTVTDNKGCAEEDSINIDLNNVIVLNTASAPSVCFNDSVQLGTIPVTTGGDGTFSYQWSSLNGNLFDSDTITNPYLLPQVVGLDTITLIATDGRDCSNSSEIEVDVLDIPDITLSPAGAPEICLNDTIILTASATDTEPGTFMYTWSNGDINDTTIVAPSDTTAFIVTVQNNSSFCSNNDTVVVVVNPLPDIIFNALGDLSINGVDSFSACANGNPTIQGLNTSVNAGADTYSWVAVPSTISFIPSPNQSTVSFNANDIDPVIGNNLIITVQDFKGCVNIDTAFVTKNAFPNANFFSSNDTICEGDTITLITSGGPDPNPFAPSIIYRYRRLSPNQAAPFYIANTNGDTTTNPFIPGGIPSSPLAIDTPITITYQVEINLNGCPSLLTTNVLVNPLPVLQANPAIDSVCFGQDVELVVLNTNPSPQVPINIYNWAHTATNNDTLIETITANDTFFVNVVDVNGCEASTEFDIRVKNLPDVTLDTFGTISICEGNTFDISALNPNTNYTYQWKDSTNIPTTIPNGVTTNALYTADTSGQFFVVVTTDGLACTDSSSAVTVIDNPLPEIGVKTIPDSTRFCFGGSVIFTDTIPRPTSFYEWKELTIGLVANNTNSITISDSGDYYVLVTDNNGCFDSSAVISFFEIPLSVDSINSGPDTVCEFSSSSYTSTINGTWILNSALGTITNSTAVLSGGNYILPDSNTAFITWNGPLSAQLFYTPDIECAVQDTFNVTVISNPVASIQGPTSGCVGEDIQLFALNGGDTYQWSINSGFGTLTSNLDTVSLSLNTPVTSAQGFDIDTLQLVQQAGTGCLDTAILIITKFDTVNAEFVSGSQSTGVCQFDSITYQINNSTPNANYSFSVISGIATINNISNGVVSINWDFVGTTIIECVATNGSCSDIRTDTFTIQQSPIDSFNYFIDGFLQTSPITNVCFTSDSVTYQLQTPNLANTFTWNLQSATAQPTAFSALNNDTTFFSVALDTPGSYILTMTESSSNGCSITLQEIVTIDDGATFDILISDSIICETDSVQVYNTSGNFDPGSVGFNTSDPANMSVSLGPGNVTIDWGGPGIGKYVIAFYGNGACSAIDTFFIDVQALADPFISPDITDFNNGVDTTFCENLRTFFFANPADTNFTYQWYNNGNPIPNSDTSRIRITESGTYSFSVQTLANGCVDSTAVGIPASVLGTPDADIIGDSVWCGAGDSVLLESVNTATNYRWIDSVSNGQIGLDQSTINIGQPGGYYLVLINGGVGENGCSDTSDVFIIEALAAPVTLWSFDSVSSFCNNQEILLNGRNAGRFLSYEWTTNGQGQIIDPFTDTTSYLPSDLDSGNLVFEFTATNACGLDNSIDTAELRLSPDASYTPSSLVAELNEFVTFTVNTEDAIIYDWVFQAGATGSGPTDIYQYTQAGDYLSFLIATNEFNCTDSFAVPIHVTRNQLIYVPNVFSPNATNADNQVMRVYGTNISSVGFEIAIFNRWGIKVYGENATLEEMRTNGWNGTQENGAELPSGVYTYYIKGQFFNGEPFQNVGTVSLIK